MIVILKGNQLLEPDQIRMHLIDLWHLTPHLHFDGQYAIIIIIMPLLMGARIRLIIWNRTTSWSLHLDCVCWVAAGDANWIFCVYAEPHMVYVLTAAKCLCPILLLVSLAHNHNGVLFCFTCFAWTHSMCTYYAYVADRYRNSIILGAENTEKFEILLDLFAEWWPLIDCFNNDSVFLGPF